MSVYDTANRLAREIKNSDEYQKYKEIREKILADTSTKNMLKDYMEKQMNLQQKQMSGQEPTQEEKEELENLRELVDLNSDIKEYLEAEYRMSVMLNDLQEILFGDLEIGVMEEEEEDEEVNQ